MSCSFFYPVTWTRVEPVAARQEQDSRRSRGSPMRAGRFRSFRPGGLTLLTDNRRIYPHTLKPNTLVSEQRNWLLSDTETSILFLQYLWSAPLKFPNLAVLSPVVETGARTL